MEQNILYGLSKIPFSLPKGTLIECLDVKKTASQKSEKQILIESLMNPIGSKHLHEIVRGKKSIAILIPGKMRCAGTKDYIPLLVEELNKAGILDSQIKIFLADGTHEQHLESDIQSLLGKEIALRICCIGHDCKDEKSLAYLGTTSYGTPVYINKQVMESDVKILTGRIVPHYFAGFSGGRKALIPGVAGFKTILANHSLTLDKFSGIHPMVKLASLDQNPIHLDMMEGARMAKPDFCFNTLMDTENKIMSAVAGDFELAHREGCQRAHKLFCKTLKQSVDVVITSPGGLPYDCNFMQSLKAFFNIQDIVRPGGAIFCIAQCAGGIHPGFLSWAKISSYNELNQAVRSSYNLAGHNSIILRELTQKVEVALFSKMESKIVQSLGMCPIATLQEGIDWILDRFKQNFTYAIVPSANLLCARLE
mgnify:CR=1 FL=1